ncbi:MAG: hypothetical protein CVT49_05155 [candidate division Zixibacteria bacterium HGW-Zixibacteria-1]|nr:MAG: hypothetical protein CVT49_05155 [candidate division Zixibacteria bacterium HGW-Zixibacteria-1]
MDISLSQARKIALHTQLLTGNSKSPKGKKGIARTIEKLGYIQIDTISVIQRAHHHTIWTRHPYYSPTMLNELQARDRRIFEYWGHAASYLPMSDYRYYLPRMHRFSDPHSKWEKQQLDKFGLLMEPVLERIRQEGPLGSKDFILPTGKKKGTWWDWRPYKVALELLFWQGKLMITRRHNFHRLYDLTERVLPKHIDTTVPDDSELGRFLVRRALSAYGIALEKEIREHLHAADNNLAGKALRELQSAGEIIPVVIKEKPDLQYYALADTIKTALKRRLSLSSVHLLSPFDNLIIQRGRMLKLFDFDYALECYVPAGKRKFGYFVLPILFGDQLVGRLDPKAERKSKTMIIQKLQLESGFDPSEEFLAALAEKLARFAHFNDCNKLKFIKMQPAKLKTALDKLVKKVEL